MIAANIPLPIKDRAERFLRTSSPHHREREWYKLIEALLALLPEVREQVIEECAAVCDLQAKRYRYMKVDEDGVATEDAAEAEELAYSAELSARAIRKLKQSSPQPQSRSE